MDKAPRKFKHYATFASVVRCVPDNKNAFLAKASIEDLRSILPDADADSDLLPIAANACVANLGNKRGDLIDTRTALAIYKKFEDKFINIEHDRSIIVGHIKKAVLSKFHADYSTGVGSEVITEDGIKDGEPFNISLAGYIYKIAAPGVASKIVEANDPMNETFLQMAMSWEVGFDDYKIMVGDNASFANSKIIDSSDPTFITYDAHLKSRGGTGIASDGKQVFRLLWGATPEDVVPLGVGLTFNPAGAVAGIVTSQATASNTPETPVIEPAAQENNTILQKNEEIISQTTASNVTNNTNMKPLANFKDVLALNDENKQEVSLANIANLINAEAERALADHAKEVRIEREAKAAAEAQVAKASEDAAKATKEIEELKGTIAKLQAEQALASAKAKFNERMASFDETHVLDADARQVVASSIDGLSDEAFATFRKNFDVLYKSQSKAALAAAEAEKNKGQTQEEPKVVAQQALASATPTGATPPNTVTDEPTLAQKLKDAFKLGDGVIVK